MVDDNNHSVHSEGNGDVREPSSVTPATSMPGASTEVQRVPSTPTGKMGKDNSSPVQQNRVEEGNNNALPRKTSSNVHLKIVSVRVVRSSVIQVQWIPEEQQNSKTLIVTDAMASVNDAR